MNEITIGFTNCVWCEVVGCGVSAYKRLSTVNRCWESNNHTHISTPPTVPIGNGPLTFSRFCIADNVTRNTQNKYKSNRRYRGNVLYNEYICHFHRILVPDPRFPDPTDRAMIWDLGSLGSGICWDPIIASSQIESRIIVQLFSINCRIFLGIFLFSNPHWQAQGSEFWVKLTIQCKMLIFIRLECNLYLTKVRRVHKNFPSTKSNPA